MNGYETMTELMNCTVGKRQYSCRILIAVSVVALAGCSQVPINPNDSTLPKVTIKVNGTSGYVEQSSVDHSNSSAQLPIEIMCIVEDPQGVKSIDLHVSDSTVDAAYCGSAVYKPGNYFVGGLPAPIKDILSGSSGKVPNKLAGIIKIGGILKLSTNPPNVSGVCYPGNNTNITIRCRGGNWSSNQGASTAIKELDINFKY